MSLGRRFLLGSAWVGGAQLAANALNLVMQLALARLLGPGLVGVYALCFAINEFLEVIGALSLSFALLQRRDAEPRHYDTALVLCALLGAGGLLVAAPIALWLGLRHSPAASGLLLAMALARLLRLLAQPAQARLERGFGFGRLGGVTLLSMVLPNALAVALAWGGAQAWSYAARDLLTPLLFLAGLLVVEEARTRLRFDRAAAAELLGFARPLFWSRTLEILIERIDALSVALGLGTRPAGLYHQARFVAESGFVASRPLERIGLNLYARLQDEPERLVRAFGVVHYFLARVMFLGAAVLVAAPEAVVQLLLGEEWIDAAAPLRWLGLYGGLLPVLHNTKSLCYALGLAQPVARLRLAQLGVFGAGIALALASGGLAAIAGVLFGANAFALLGLWRIARRAGLPLRSAELLQPAALLGACALLAGALLDRGLGLAAGDPLRLVLVPLLYASLLALAEREQLRERFVYLREIARRAPE